MDLVPLGMSALLVLTLAVSLEEGWHRFRCPDPTTGAMEPTGSLPVQEARPCGLRLAPCLQALAAAVLLMQETDKLTLGQCITLQVPHQVTSLLNGTARRGMTRERVARYQALLVKTPG
jgi:hypothetical protein